MNAACLIDCGHHAHAHAREQSDGLTVRDALHDVEPFTPADSPPAGNPTTCGREFVMCLPLLRSVIECSRPSGDNALQCCESKRGPGGEEAIVYGPAFGKPGQSGGKPERCGRPGSAADGMAGMAAVGEVLFFFD